MPLLPYFTEISPLTLLARSAPGYHHSKIASKYQNTNKLTCGAKGIEVLQAFISSVRSWCRAAIGSSFSNKLRFHFKSDAVCKARFLTVLFRSLSGGGKTCPWSVIGRLACNLRKKIKCFNNCHLNSCCPGLQPAYTLLELVWPADNWLHDYIQQENCHLRQMPPLIPNSCNLQQWSVTCFAL